MVEPVAVIFAGGRGTRLWPLSRAAAPKQFQPIADDVSLTTTTIQRLLPVIPPERIFVSTTDEFADMARKSLETVPAENLIIEQGGKGPATALALSLATVVHRFGDAPLFTCPSDHLFGDHARFARAVAEMIAQVRQHPESVVMLGAEPTRPDPGLGYFRARAFEDGDVLEVVEQIEKPGVDAAAQLIAEGSVYWNTMCYALPSECAIEVYRRRRPEAMTAVERWVGGGSVGPYDGPAVKGLELVPFFEDGMRQLLVSRDLGWNDIGNWPRLAASLNNGTAGIGEWIGHEASDVYVASTDGRPVVVFGVSGVIIVTHEDAVYVLDKERAADEKALEQLRQLLGETRKDLQ